MNIIIPLWFYGFDSIMCIISAMVGFALSFFFYNIQSLTKNKRHKYLYIGFLLLSMSLFLVGIGSAYSYINFKMCAQLCTLGIMDKVFSIEDFTYFIYFGLSLIAYFMFILTYKDDKTKFSKILVPILIAVAILILGFVVMNQNRFLWYSYSAYFHLTALIMIGFVVFKTMSNYYNKRNTSTMLVMSSFIFIFLFHLLYFFSFANTWSYVLSHISLLAGFSMLLYMLLRSNKK